MSRRDLSHPPNGPSILFEELDPEKAYQSLDGYDHFFSDTLRAHVRCIQMRISEAQTLLDRAERRFRDHEINGETLADYFRHRMITYEHAVLKEALAPSVETCAETDRQCDKLEDIEYIQNNIQYWQAQTAEVARHRILRGKHHEALSILGELMEELEGEVRIKHVTFYQLMAAASLGAGLDEQARKCIDNVSLGMGFVTQPFFLLTFSYKMYGLLSAWGLRDEAKPWLKRANAVPCSDEVRQLCQLKTDTFLRASAATQCVYVY